MKNFDKRKAALLVIDMQKDFVDKGAPVEAEGGREIIPAIAELAEEARSAGVPVFFSQEMHRADRADYGIMLEYEPECCVEGTPGLEIVDGLDPKPQDFRIVNKRRYNAFMGTDLEFLLRGLKVENLIITGVCTDVCVISTVYHARHLDYRVFIVKDCVAGSTRERHEAALKCMEHVFGQVVTSQEVIEALRSRAP